MKQALFILCLTISPVMAASNPLSCELEPNSKPCAVEDWRAYDTDGYIEIEGTTTCAEGSITFRAYDEAGNWLGNGFSGIGGYTFQAILQAAYPKELKLRCTIKGR